MTTRMSAEGAREAFEMLRPHLADLAEVRRGNVNLQRVAIFAAATGRWVRSPGVREQFAALPAAAFDVAHVDRLEPTALALWHALVEAKRAAVGASQVAVAGEVIKQAKALKRRMYQVIEYHLGSDSAVRAELDAIREGTGYMDLAEDLMRLARLYEAHAPALAGDTTHYRQSDREEASRMAHVIVHELGEVRQSEAAIWSDHVRRTWTLLANSYDEISAAGRFLLRHQDAEARFPSLITVARARPSRGPAGDAPRDDGSPDDVHSDQPSDLADVLDSSASGNTPLANHDAA